VRSYIELPFCTGLLARIRKKVGDVLRGIVVKNNKIATEHLGSITHAR
jgi:hypothetical protein